MYLIKDITVILYLFVAMLTFSGASSVKANVEESIFLPHEVILNPNKITPLAAVVKFSTVKPAEIEIRVVGQNGAKDIVHTFDGYKKNHEIPVLGLYAGRKTKIELTAKTNSDTEKKEIFIETPKIHWKGLFLQNKKDNNNPVNWFLSDGIVIDENADIRFFFDGKGTLLYLSGDEIISESRIQGLKRYTMTGSLLQAYPYPEGFVSFTHGISQRTDGNFLVIGSYRNSEALIAGSNQKTHRDFIIELDYKTGKKVRGWDIAELLNPDRTALVQAGTKDYGLDDFCHLNSVQYNPSDDSMICSCRNSGVFKVLLKENVLKWLITPNIGLNKSGRDGKGPEISSKVLKAVDSQGRILPQMIQKGYQAHADFKWPTSTHHARSWGDGYISVFDNSGSVFDKKLITTEESIASIYKVDEREKTVQHVFKAPQGCYSAPAGSVLLDKNKDIVTSFIAQCHDKSYIATSWGYIRTYNFKTREMLSEILIHKAGSSYFYEITPFSFYQKTGGLKANN